MAHTDRSTSAAVLHDSRAELSDAQRQLEVAAENLRVSEVAQSTAAEEAAESLHAAAAATVEVHVLKVRICLH